jgi:tetratricopeptide (TPR) repeat protein
MAMPASDGYSARDVAGMLGLSVRQVRSYAGFLSPGRGRRGEYRFTFQDLVLLRTAKDLVASRVPASRVKRALSKLKRQLPEGRALTGIRIFPSGRALVARDGEVVWNPDSGQAHFDFAEDGVRAEAGSPPAVPVEERLDAEGWLDLAGALEDVEPARARSAYEKALSIDPSHADAHVNVGRLLHEEGDLEAAEEHYRSALASEPGHAIAAFNLGVVLEDRGRAEDAATAYRAALKADPSLADAHYRLADVYERLGRKGAAIRHLSAYRKLTTP